MLWVLCIVAKRIKYHMSNIKKSKDYNALYVHTPHGLVAIFWNSTNWWMSRTKNAKITTHMVKVHNVVAEGTNVMVHKPNAL